MEFLLILLGWAVPLGLAVFLVSSLWQITKAMGSIERELASVRELLERQNPR